MTTKEKIKSLALNDPIINAHLTLYRNTSSVTWEEVLELLVLALIETKDRLQEELIERLENSERPNIPYVSSHGLHYAVAGGKVLHSSGGFQLFSSKEEAEKAADPPLNF